MPNKSPLTPSSPPRGLSLSSDDVTRLLTDVSAVTREGMTDRLAAAYGKEEYGQTESMVAEQIFRLLLRDTEVRVRIKMAEQLKASKRIPHDIVVALAKDVEEVALPVLQWSEVLSDEDLVDILRSTQEITRQTAVCRRKKVSTRVSDVLIESGHQEVARELVNNPGAAISLGGLKQIVDRHGEAQDILNNLAERSSLPVSVVEKLITRVSHDLSEKLQHKYQIAGTVLHEETERTRESTTLELLRRSISDEELDKLITQLIAFKRLTPTIIINALCQGNLHFFELALAKLSDVKVENARKLISDRSGLGFKGLYEKAQLPAALCQAIAAVVDTMNELREAGVKPQEADFASRLAERTMQRCEGKKIENLPYVLTLVRRGALPTH